MGKWSRYIKDRACELADGYQEARDREFNEQFRDMFNIETEIITEDDLQGFIDSFTFSEENDWALAQAEAELESAEDARMQLAKDER